jgi:nicotinamidase-related amidase
VASVINFLKYKSQIEKPVLILAGLHQADFSFLDEDVLRDVLDNCEMLLESARATATSVAFVRCVAPPSSVSEPRSYPAWLKGFEPKRDDMIFDVTQASCYSSTEFAQAMEDAGGGFTIAGLFGETVCLSTGVDAYHRRQKFTYLSDASLCRNVGSMPDEMFHASVTQVIARYGEVMSSSDWRALLSEARRTK